MSRTTEGHYCAKLITKMTKRLTKKQKSLFNLFWMAQVSLFMFKSDKSCSESGKKMSVA